MGKPSLGPWCDQEKGPLPLSCPQRDTAPMVRAGGEAERGSGFVEGIQPIGAAQRGGVLGACLGGQALLAKPG